MMYWGDIATELFDATSLACALCAFVEVASLAAGN